MRGEIIPSILTDNILDARQKLSQIKQLTAQLQIDVLDNSLLPGMTCLAGDFSRTDFSGCELEVHFMVVHPEIYFAEWIAVGAKRFVIQAESHPSAQMLQDLKRRGVEPVICINNDTSTDALLPYLPLISRVQFMTIIPGAQGRKLIPDTLEKIAAFSRDFPAYVVAADGGINERTILDVARAGASRFIVGSDLFSARTTITEKWGCLTQLLSEA